MRYQISSQDKAQLNFGYRFVWVCFSPLFSLADCGSLFQRKNKVTIGLSYTRLFFSFFFLLDWSESQGLAKYDVFSCVIPWVLVGFNQHYISGHLKLQSGMFYNLSRCSRIIWSGGLLRADMKMKSIAAVDQKRRHWNKSLSLYGRYTDSVHA